MNVIYSSSSPAYTLIFAATNLPSPLTIGDICVHFKWSQAPTLIPEEAIVYTMGFILLSGYSMILWISSKVGALSSAYILPFGRPRVIFFHGMTMSVTSQNILIVLT